MRWGRKRRLPKTHIANADYVLALKANHPKLYGQIKDWFEQAQAQNFAGIEVSRDEHVESSHHRIEKRQVFSVPVSHLPCYINKLVGLD